MSTCEATGGDIARTCSHSLDYSNIPRKHSKMTGEAGAFSSASVRRRLRGTGAVFPKDLNLMSWWETNHAVKR